MKSIPVLLHSMAAVVTSRNSPMVLFILAGCWALAFSASACYGQQGVILYRGVVPSDDFVIASEYVSIDSFPTVTNFVSPGGKKGTVPTGKVIEILKYPNLVSTTITTDQEVGVFEKILADFSERAKRYPKSSAILQPWIQKLNGETQMYRRSGKVKVSGNWISKEEFEKQRDADLIPELTITLAGGRTKTFKNVKLGKVEDAGVVLMHSAGVSKVVFDQLPEAYRAKWERKQPEKPVQPETTSRMEEVKATREAIVPDGTNAGEERELEIVPGVNMTFCWCPAGSVFKTDLKKNLFDEVTSQGKSEVFRITKGFWIGKHEVSQEQWVAVMNSNPSQVKGRNNPVEHVSWDDVQKFLAKLGTRFCLPSEAQWEYACRAGTTTAFCFGDDAAQLGDYGWYGEGDLWVKPHPVGQKKPNAWGIHDMHGNVWEWCADWFVEEFPGPHISDPIGPPFAPSLFTFHVRRGGSVSCSADLCRQGYRDGKTSGYKDARTFEAKIKQQERDNFMGLRLAIPVSPSPGGEMTDKNFKNAYDLDMVWCPLGVFQMGRSKRILQHDDTLHQVTLSTGFWIARTEVTQAQWQKLMGSNPSRFPSSEAKAPVENVSWNDAMAFCQKLTEAERKAGKLPSGEEYTLPTEAQWEYACRAGCKEERNVEGAATGELAWFYDNSDKKTHAVGEKMPNAWGIFDMLGNVSEWCLDWYANYPEGSVGVLESPDYGPAVIDPVGPSGGSGRVVRGGDWTSGDVGISSARRIGFSPDNRCNGLVGFRPVRTAIRSPGK